jgi:NADH-ubiquinone oxidoreductase chain 2
VVGLSQFRIKRLFAYSTISHLGFILLALTINSIESIQAFIFYIMQYSITNLNAFILLVTIGYTFYLYINNKGQNNFGVSQEEDKNNLQDINNSPIQLISQLKGYFYIKPVLALSLAITLYSFVGVPPLIGFFAKQMVLSAAIDNGYIFMALIAILTSVISAVYYLSVIKQIFFDKAEDNLNPELDNINLRGNLSFLALKDKKESDEILPNKSEGVALNFDLENIVLSSSLTLVISSLTLMIVLFMFMPTEITGLSSILALMLFNP